MEIQQDLEFTSNVVVPEQVSELADRKSKMEEMLQTMEQKTQELESWTTEMSGKENMDVEDRLISYDDISQQLIKLNAEQLAIDDVMYYLDYAFAHGTDGNNSTHGGGDGAGTIDLQAFLKEMRKLARRQFHCKMHVMKISAYIQQEMSKQQGPIMNNMQQQQQPRGMPPARGGPAPPPPYMYPQHMAGGNTPPGTMYMSNTSSNNNNLNGGNASNGFNAVNTPGLRYY